MLIVAFRYHLLKLRSHFLWPPDLDFTAKLENPGKEGGAEGDLGSEEEVSVVYELRFGFVAEVVDYGVHGVLVA